MPDMMQSVEYKDYRWKWENYPKLHKIDRVPINLDIELTTRCNLKCIMCEHSFNPPKPMDLPIHIVKKVIDEFAEKGGLATKLCYLGEPLLYKDLFEVIKYAKKKGILETIIATNGNLLDKIKCREVIESGLDYIIFSVDSCDPDIYSQIRVKGSLEKVRLGILRLNALKQLYRNNKPFIQVQAIPMKENKYEIELKSYHRYWKSFVDKVRISPYCEDYTITEEIGPTPEFHCPSVYQRMTIRADGKVAICCGERHENKIIGDIEESTLEQIWTGYKFMEIRRLMNEGNSHLIECCKTCTLRKRHEEERSKKKN